MGESLERSRDPLVTVGLAVYNGERFLAESLDAILNQHYENFVVIISDNASTDGSAEICQRYARADSRVTYFRNASNVGMPANYNLLFSRCSTKYFRWATADDLVSQDMLESAVDTMESNDSLALCYSQAHFIDASGRVTGQWSDRLHLMQDDPVERFDCVVRNISRVHHHLGLMRTDLVRSTMLLKEHPSSDKGFVAEMSLRGKFSQIPKFQFFRRMHEDSSSWKPTDDMAHQIRRYHSAGSNGMRFVRFRVHMTYWQAIARSGLGAVDRARAYKNLCRYALDDRQELWGQLLADSRAVLEGRSGQ